MKNKYLLIFSHAFPYLLIIAYIGGLVGSIAIGRYDFAIIGSLLSIPMLAAAISLYYIYHREPNVLSRSFPIVSFKQRTLILLFGIAFFLTIIIGLLCPIRSPYFLGGIVVLYAIIFLQIFSKDQRSVFVLIETMLAMAFLIYETTLKYPYYFGMTDIIPHVFMSTVTHLSGRAVPPDLSSGYAYFPLYHIWIAMSSHVLAIDIKPTLFLITCPVYVMATILLYYLFKEAAKDEQIPLMVCLLYSIDSTVTFYGTYMITRAAAYIGFVILLYLLISKSGSNLHKRSVSFRSLAILVTVYILLVHQVSTPQILLLLLLLMGCEWFVGSKKHLSNSFLGFEIVLFFAYWFYIAFDYAGYVVKSRFSPLVFDTVVIREPTQLFSPLAFLFNNADTLIFLYFAIIGIGYLFWKQKSPYASVFGLFALLTIILYVPSPIHAIWQTITVFRFDRFMLLITPFMAFVMGWGLYAVLRYFQMMVSIKTAGSIVFSLFVLYCCGAIGIIAGEDLSASRASFTSEELDGFDYIYSYVPYGSTTLSDYYTNRYLSKKFSESDNLGLPFYRSRIIANASDIQSFQGFVIIPYKQFMNHGLAFRKGSELDPEGGTYPYLPSSETISTLSNSLAEKEKIYSSESIELYCS